MRSVSPRSRPYVLRFTTHIVMTAGRVSPRAPGSSHRLLMRPPRRLRRPGSGEPDAADGRRNAPAGGARAEHPGVQADRRSRRRREDLHERGMHRLPHAAGGARHRNGRPESQPVEAGLPQGDRARDARQGRHAVVRRQAHRAADRRRRRVRGEVDRRHPVVELPPSFPRDVAAFAVDLDRTLIGPGLVLRPRTRAAIERVRATGTHVIVVTGRMFQSVLPFLRAARLDDPVVCYQGALVADPLSGDFLRHVPIPLPAAREAMDAVIDAGFHLNAYVDDELYVAAETPEAHAYADLNKVEMHVVGDLRAWLRDDPTKLVAVGDPDALDALEAVLKPRFAGTLFVSKSLPHFLEFAHPDVNKGAGLTFVAERLGFTAENTVACGDGENDRELLDWAGFGVAVANAHEEILARAQLVVPSVDNEGVALLFDAYLDSRS